MPSISTARPSVSTARLVCTARPSISTARPSVSTARPVCTARPSINTARPVSTASPSISTARPVYASRPIYLRMDNVRLRGSCTPIKRSYYIKPALRPKAVVNTDSGSFMLKKGNPEILLQDHAVMDIGCSSHMTGNKAYLSDYEDLNGGFVAFRS
ncbi:hypothetical protein Tco_0898224 [Tanacetum coccineum]